MFTISVMSIIAFVARSGGYVYFLSGTLLSTLLAWLQFGDMDNTNTSVAYFYQR